jgi:uncharacterized membrane protein
MIDPAGTIAGGSDAYAFNGSEQILVREPQASATTAVTPYQRVTNAFDVTEAGQRDCYGVRADGTDDFYTTAGNVDFSGTDKVTVFAAVRRLSDVLRGTIVNNGTGAGDDNTFQLRGPRADANSDTLFLSRGTSAASVVSSNPAPHTGIFTAIGDISAPLSQLRLNGVVVDTNTSSQGTGNYSNLQLTILTQTSGSSRNFNGDLYALVVAGGSYPLSTIQRVERILSRITPTVNL